MSERKQPKYKILAKSKSGGLVVDVGALFEGRFGLDVSLRRGTVIKITRGWDKVHKAEVDLPEPIYISADTHYLNANPPKDFAAEEADNNPRVNALKQQVKETFGLDANDDPDSILPF